MFEKRKHRTRIITDTYFTLCCFVKSGIVSTPSSRCVGMTSDVIRTFDTITDLHEVLTEIRGEPAVNRTTTCKQRFGFWF
jgi:hypothetical protein